MVPWVERPTLDIDLDEAPHKRYAGLPEEVRSGGRLLLGAVMKEVPRAARILADVVRLRTWNRFHSEAVALAREVGVSWRDVVMGNVSYDLRMMQIGCSTVVLPTPDGPVVARNMDWWPEDILAQTSYRIRCWRKGQLHHASAGWPGSIGVVTGMSGRGFAVVLNAVRCPEPRCKRGYPVLLHIRRVLEDAADFDAALRLLAETRLAAPALFTLAGSGNEQRVVIERSPTRHALRWPGSDEPLITTNDYRLLYPPQASDGPEFYQTTCTRHDALRQFFARHRASQDVEDAALLYVLSERAVIQSITAQHVLIRPRLRELRTFVPRSLIPTPEQPLLA